MVYFICTAFIDVATYNTFFAKEGMPIAIGFMTTITFCSLYFFIFTMARVSSEAHKPYKLVHKILAQNNYLCVKSKRLSLMEKFRVNFLISICY